MRVFRSVRFFTVNLLEDVFGKIREVSFQGILHMKAPILRY